jgi:hypothetical protein
MMATIAEAKQVDTQITTVFEELALVLSSTNNTLHG